MQAHKNNQPRCQKGRRQAEKPLKKLSMKTFSYAHATHPPVHPTRPRTPHPAGGPEPSQPPSPRQRHARGGGPERGPRKGKKKKNQINNENQNKENIYINNHLEERRKIENQIKCNTQKLSKILGSNFEIQNETENI